MQKTNLKNVNKRINIKDYTTFEYVEFLRSFKEKNVIIRFIEDEEIKTIKVRIDYTQLPHLIGFQYAYEKKANKYKYYGKLAIDTFERISFKEIERNINKNKIKIGNDKNSRYISWDIDIKPRFEYLPFALNTICSKYSLKKQIESEEARLVKTKMRGKYFYYKFTNKDYLIFSLIKTKVTYTFESFIVNDGLRFLGALDTLEVIDVSLERTKV